ncbi:hypothetical protein CC1G_00818 [Coprinopsis cinerea okayama7|uniref:Wings apart-like protein C-terminal domain-containing protein n=1 Tax=Coprinopsis cinerea (strain Okayama-7 / 130 / ATCC MYA-4618 / FGSC 9003) TaxID=240176 RepID=A8N8U3_COPC7|nr:hypothetical protein CC1G_00818 [Coprinopsis cinerea okayama7\|eukprot:XP_001831271.2 hypothetical protein CC1G_00818 [Coprinopsis cinerea okayama7\
MPINVTRTYGKRSGSKTSTAALKRKSTSEIPQNVEEKPLPGSSNTSTPQSNVHAEKKRKLDNDVAVSIMTKRDDELSSVVSASNSRPATPTKLSKRMLGRSKTETSVTSTTESPSLDTRRTPSLPILPSEASPSSLHTPSKSSTAVSASPLRQTPSFTKFSTVLATTSGTATISASLNGTSTTTISRSRSTVTRTYAGSSRSFLMPLSSFSGNPLDPNAPAPQADDYEDEFSRESYSTLRQKYGVDDTSEDEFWNGDAVPSTSANPRSNSGTPVSTPSKANRARGKARSGSTSPSKSRSKKDGTPSKSQLPAPPPLPSNMMNPLKSITELRNKGETRRFLDEVAYLLDGMAVPSASSKSPANIGLVRASALELITKLFTSADFSRKAKAADIYGKVYGLFLNAGAGIGLDKLLDALLLTFLVLVSRDPSSLKELGELYPPSSSPEAVRLDAKGKNRSSSTVISVSSRSLVDILFHLFQLHCPPEPDDEDGLGIPTDPLVLISDPTHSDAYFKRAGIGKKEKGQLSSLYSILTSQPTFSLPTKNEERKTLSTPMIAVALLHVLPTSLLPNDRWRVNILVKSLNGVTRAVLESAGSPKPKDKLGVGEVGLDWLTLHAHLRLLDLYLLGQWSLVRKDGDGEGTEGSEDDDNIWKRMVERLVKLGRVAVSRRRADEDEVDEAGNLVDQCLEALLRVLVTLTHGESKWGTCVASSEGKGDPTLSWLTLLVEESGNRIKSIEGAQTRPSGGGTRRKRKLYEMEEETGTEAAESDSESEEDTFQQQRRREAVERRTRALDRLCLSLALLTNLVQEVDDVSDLLRDGGMLVALVGVYKQQSDLSEELSAMQSSEGEEEAIVQEREQAQVDASFLRGHLAVLFALLMKNEENKETLLPLLPSRGESTKAKLNRLVDHAKRFVSFFDVVQQTNQDQEGLSQEEQNEKKVAMEAVGFLESLRDS